MQNNELNEQQRKSVSKFFSLILRHRPEQIGLTLDKNGWADIDDLLAKPISTTAPAFASRAKC